MWCLVYGLYRLLLLDISFWLNFIWFHNLILMWFYRDLHVLYGILLNWLFLHNLLWYILLNCLIYTLLILNDNVLIDWVILTILFDINIKRNILVNRALYTTIDYRWLWCKFHSFFFSNYWWLGHLCFFLDRLLKGWRVQDNWPFPTFFGLKILLNVYFWLLQNRLGLHHGWVWSWAVVSEFHDWCACNVNVCFKIFCFWLISLNFSLLCFFHFHQTC